MKRAFLLLLFCTACEKAEVPPPPFLCLPPNQVCPVVNDCPVVETCPVCPEHDGPCKGGDVRLQPGGKVQICQTMGESSIQGEWFDLGTLMPPFPPEMKPERQ